MDLTPYITELREEFATAAVAAGPDTEAAAERLMAPLDSAIRLALLSALSGAAAEITSELAPGSVELRLRGREPEFAVSLPDVESNPEALAAASGEATPWVPAEGDDATMVRINLRLPQDLKDRVEAAARQGGLSVNSWLVRTAAAALAASEGATRTTRRTPQGGARYSGWVR
jgi:hypothetical protein